MNTDRVLAMVLAGGEGTRLAPLTAVRSKPAVPFGARYRIVDFVLSNLVNSEIYSIYMLVQYRSQPLIEHIRNAWVLAPILPQPLRHRGAAADARRAGVVPGHRRRGLPEPRAAAELHAPALVVVFGADHIYRMDVRAMIEFHRARRADVTVAALPVPLAQASAFGVIDCDADGRIERFDEKPAHPPPMPGDPSQAFASMGNYIFDDRGAASTALRESRERGREGLRPRRAPAARANAPRVRVRLRAEPRARRAPPGGAVVLARRRDGRRLLRRPRWTRSGRRRGSTFSTRSGRSARATTRARRRRSWTAASSAARSARARWCGARTIRGSVIRREVLIEDDVVLDRCVVMDHCVIRRGARLRNTIVDRYNTIASGVRIGYEPEADRTHYA